MKSQKYLKFVRSLDCCICFQPGAEAHHVKNPWTSSGVSVKPSDVHSIPLCRNHHQEFHNKGRIDWEDKYQVSQSDLVIRTQVLAMKAGVL